MTERQLVRRGVAAGAIGALTLAVGGVGVATAANGGSLILGQSNTATATTAIIDHHGTPLRLKGAKSKPPLKVNSRKEVKRLNANLLGGKTATQLASSGSGVTNTTGTDVSTDNTNATLLAKTAALTPGTYELSSSVEMDSDGTDGSRCGITPHAVRDGIDDSLAFGAAPGDGIANLVVDVTIKVSHPEPFGLVCYTYDPDAFAYSATLQAVKVASFKAGSVPTVAHIRKATARTGG
jgi:hypothetical protein